MRWFAEESDRISPQRISGLSERTVEETREQMCRHPKRVLLLPPDITRAHSGAGRMAGLLYRQFCREADVHVIPTLGQRVPRTPEQDRRMFGSILNEQIHAHDWTVLLVGEGPSWRFLDVRAVRFDALLMRLPLQCLTEEEIMMELISISVVLGIFVLSFGMIRLLAKLS